MGSLGNGSYANVFEVYFRQAPMAVKVLNLSRPGSSGVSEETLRHFKYAWVLLSQSFACCGVQSAVSPALPTECLTRAVRL